MSKYSAAYITATVEVKSYEQPTEADTHRWGVPRRTTKLELRESFKDDAGLDKAIDALAATIREAARR